MPMATNPTKVKDLQRNFSSNLVYLKFHFFLFFSRPLPLILFCHCWHCQFNSYSYPWLTYNLTYKRQPGMELGGHVRTRDLARSVASRL